MSTKTKIVLAAAFVLVSASTAPVAAASRTYYGQPSWSDGYAGGFVPGSKAEHDWFARASRPSNL